MTISSRWSAESPRTREWGQELPPEIQPCVGPVFALALCIQLSVAAVSFYSLVSAAQS